MYASVDYKACGAGAMRIMPARLSFKSVLLSNSVKGAAT